MAARALACVLLLCAPLLAGDPPERDPFLAALAGKSGPDAVAAPDFDPEAEALSWSLRSRREIVDALAARILRGEAKGWESAAQPAARLPPSPSRVPADFDPTGIPVTDRLAAWVPGDAAAAFFESLPAAVDAVGELAKFLPEAFPVLCGDPPGGRRDALRRAREMLLLPTIWGANPNVRTGTRQVAIVASDPDLRWAPDIALLAEVDDASLVRFHRQASLRWEEHGGRTLRVDGLDAVSDDGSVRSFFALEGGIAAWSTTRSLRERVLAAGAGKAPSLLTPPAREYFLARKTFPAAEGGALLVVPDAFLARSCSLDTLARRVAGIRCDAERLLADAEAMGGMSSVRPLPAGCPNGGRILLHGRVPGAACAIHGSASNPVPIGDLPQYRVSASGTPAEAIASAGVPVSARWKRGLEVHAPKGPWGGLILSMLQRLCRGDGYEDGSHFVLRDRIESIRGMVSSLEVAKSRYRALTGIEPASFGGCELIEDETGVTWERGGRFRDVACLFPPEPRERGGVLRLGLRLGTESGASGTSSVLDELTLEWR